MLMVDIDKFKTKLLRRHKELALKVDDIEDQLDDPKDPDFEERAVEREGDEVMVIQAQSAFDEIKAIDAALERMKIGEYGLCLSCQNEISAERLMAIPHAALCRNCMSD